MTDASALEPKDAMPLGAATVRIPASCGELMQGELFGKSFLVNSPIDFYATATAAVTSEKSLDFAQGDLFPKVRMASEMVLNNLGAEFGVALRMSSNVPRGKGMASSTSEISAALYAIAKTLGREISPELVSRILIEVDRSSDALFCPGITAVHQLAGTVLSSYRYGLKIRFLIVDCGGTVETAMFDRQRASAVARSRADEIYGAFSLLQSGLENSDAAMIGKASTISSIINQEVLFKPQLPALLEMLPEDDYLGINCAHTGTVLGIMYDPLRHDATRLRKQVGAVVDERSVIGDYELIAGNVIFD